MTLQLSPDQLQELAEQIAAHGIPPNWEEWGLLVALMVITTTAGALLGARYAKIGEISAMDSKLNSLVNQTQALTAAASMINSNLSRLDWLEQKKWEIKQKFYWDTLARLNTMKTCLHEMATVADFLADASKRIASLKAQVDDQGALLKRIKSRKKSKKVLIELTSALTRLHALKAEGGAISSSVDEKDSRFNELENLRYATAMELLSETATANVFITLDVLDALGNFARQSPKRERGKPFADHIRELENHASSLHTDIVFIARKDLRMTMHGDAEVS